MKPSILKRQLYNRKTLTVAQALLGKFLVRKIGNKIIAGMITETEAYCGPNDLASHASRGRTPRTEIMFGPAGLAYIYLIYGMYYCLNIVTEKENYPAAVLIRAIKIDGVDYKKTNGPGKVCKIMKIDKSLNGVDMCNNNNVGVCQRQTLWVEDHGAILKPSQIKKTPRIGVDYAGAYRDKKWGFVVI